MSVLGDTLTEIAFEKAGILKVTGTEFMTLKGWSSSFHYSSTRRTNERIGKKSRDCVRK